VARIANVISVTAALIDSETSSVSPLVNRGVARSTILFQRSRSGSSTTVPASMTVIGRGRGGFSSASAAAKGARQASVITTTRSHSAARPADWRMRDG
jgi:hypothetical protein